MNINESNPYTAPSSLIKPIKAKKTGVFKLANNVVSKILVGRESSEAKNKALDSDTEAKLLLDPRGSASRNHAKITFNPIESKLLLQDRGSAYGSIVEIASEDGSTEKIFITDIAGKQASDDIAQRTGVLQSGLEQSDLKDFKLASSIELDFSKPWRVSFGAEKYQQVVHDQLVNDGNSIYYLKDTMRSNLVGKAEKKDLIFQHDTLKRQSADEGFAQRTRTAFGAVLARIGLMKKPN